MRVALVQMNSTVGDLEGNAIKIKKYLYKARKCQADLAVFPELAITGYPPQDLLYNKDFIKENKTVLKEIFEPNDDVVAIVGFVDYDNKGNLYNAAAIFKGNIHVQTISKTLLPTYDVFDEDRYFVPSREKDVKPITLTINKRETKLGVEICEDLWDEDYDTKVTDLLAGKGAELIINISASPFYVGKRAEREKQVTKKAVKNNVPIFLVNLVGGQDELVFDGQSLAVNSNGDLIAFGKKFNEDLVITDIDIDAKIAEKIPSPPYNKEEEMFGALVLGVKDYFRKTGFDKAVIGMSGGIDSSLTTCIAVKALGKENVIGISMPSRFSSEHSKSDAQQLADNLGICFIQFSIQDLFNSYHKTLEKPLEQLREKFSISKKADDLVADENIQPRIRGNCLMDISNRLKDLKILVLNTGNKTELALGYCTLYGDMAGGIGALSDVSKLEVYKLAKYVNEKKQREIIPENVFLKKPSPELREDQFDPFNFEVISPLVDEIIEKRKSKQELIAKGYPKDAVEDTIKRIKNSEYKRRQAVPGIKITPKAFGIGRKMPIVNKYES